MIPDAKSAIISIHRAGTGRSEDVLWLSSHLGLKGAVVTWENAPPEIDRWHAAPDDIADTVFSVSPQ